MTESEWLTSSGAPSRLFKHVSRSTSVRKLRLLGAACCRLIWDRLPPSPAHDALVVVERYADGLASAEDFARAASLARLQHDVALATSEGGSLERAATLAVVAATHTDAAVGLDHCRRWVVDCAFRAAEHGQERAAMRAVREQLSHLFREVIGNPFRPWKSVPDFLGGGVVQPDGRTVHPSDTVRQLAHGIHADQAFDRLPILADALEESGVTDAALLAHCRNETRHVRGCWALDVALGRV
jgi:hypothetical protein